MDTKQITYIWGVDQAVNERRVSLILRYLPNFCGFCKEVLILEEAVDHLCRSMGAAIYLLTAIFISRISVYKYLQVIAESAVVMTTKSEPQNNYQTE